MKRVCPEFFIARYGLQKNVKQPLRYGVRTQPLLCAVSNKKISNGLEKNDLKAGVTVKDLSIKTWCLLHFLQASMGFVTDQD